MLCPKCKKEIEDNSLKCSFCGAKVGSLCKLCGAYNPITAQECAQCGNILLRICPDCGAANLPGAIECRKCKTPLIIKQEKKETVQTAPKYTASMNSQQKVKTRLLEAIKDADSKVITIGGESGIGKNLVLRYSISELKNAKLIWLLGTCTQISQLSPFGFFQDVFLNFFNINNFCPDTLQLKKNSIKFFKQDFPTLANNEILDLLNLLYPENTDKYENIYYNKAKMFMIMKKVVVTILEKMKAVFIIDNFEHIDGMSYDFLEELLKDDFILERSKFIIISSEPKPGMGRLPSPKLIAENYVDLTIAPFTPQQIEMLLGQYSGQRYEKEFLEHAIKVANGNPAAAEQIALLDGDFRRNRLKQPKYESLENVIDLRLNLLKQEDLRSYRMLVAMSVLGKKFYPAMLENFDNNTSEEFERIIEKLVERGFISQINTLSFEFKSSEIWKLLVANLKNDDNFEEILNMLYEILSIYKQSSIALLGYIVQKLSNNDHAFEIWTILSKQACYIGDIGLYIIAQKQALKLIENKTNPFFQKVKKNIYTRVGKLLEPMDFDAAFEYLQTAVMMLEDSDESEHIELLGYLASCTMKAGNYWGTIECIDNVLTKIPEDMRFEKILIKSRQTRPLLKLGNYGQLINLVETELLPEIEKVLAKGKDLSTIRISDLYRTWIGVYFDFAEALIFQGDNKMFDVIQSIFDILEKNKTTEPDIMCKTYLLLALANTIKGDFKTSKKILEDLLKEYPIDNLDSFIISRWNFIDILNKFFEKDYNTLYSELFNVAAYANNVNDTFTKNILKTLLAKILKDNDQTKKALEILEEQVSYFAKSKVATGVLLSWYLIAEIKLITNGTQFALDIAMKALDIAQGPNINNYYFIALFNKLIGEIYLAKQDFESSKVYIEKAIFISKQFGMEYILLKCYLQMAKLYQELALPKTSKRIDYIKQALKMFQMAKNLTIVPEQSSIQKNIKEELNVITSFCKLNGISLKKDSK